MLETACCGATHSSDWKKLGFDSAAGAPGVHADGADSFAAFLNHWGNGNGFGEAIDAANDADPAEVLDTFASNVLKFPDVNSQRKLVGRANHALASAPDE